ncbi:hypothetical protein ACFQY3_18565 [Paenibacillus farraposensis]|uniref:hypothetical protein n=1 Tax=Paenibacillus farraposensis TaxID=2807095 RepID=UPI001E2B7D69|nr:hypothetical protein [Paenibacillus farraposensis]
MPCAGAFYDKKTDKVEFNVGAYDSHEKLHETKFIVPVEALYVSEVRQDCPNVQPLNGIPNLQQNREVA